MGESEKKPRRGLYGKMLSGSLWGVGVRWTMRLMGMVSVIILARLLSPADFGLVAMATVFMGLIGSFGSLGLGQLLIRTENPSRDDCDTAWTMGIIQQAIVTAMILLASPLAVRYFGEPRLYPVIALISLSSLVSATSNIGMTLVRKELNFSKDFWFQFYGKLSVFIPTVALAFTMRDYWALVLGTVIGTFWKLGMSYHMHPYRPRWCLVRAKEYWLFSISIIAMHVAKFLKQKLSVLVVGGKGNPATMGAYNVAAELAAMATQEIVVAVWRGLYPTFATIRHDTKLFLEAYGHLLSTLAIVCLPLGFGLAAIADDAVLVVLGQKWLEAIAPLKWLAISAALLALIDAMSHHVLILSGHENRAALVMWLQLAVLAPIVIGAGTLYGTMEAIAIGTTIYSATMVPIVAAILWATIGFGPAMMLRAFWRPVAATAIMVTSLQAYALPAQLPALIRLLADVSVGAFVYATSLCVLWMLAGRPAGLERAAWDIVRRTIRRVAA